MVLTTVSDLKERVVQDARRRKERAERIDQVEEELSSEEFINKPILPIREWISSEYHCGSLATTLFPFWKEKLIYVVENNVHEIIIGGSIGNGKTTFARACQLWSTYYTSCVNPHTAWKNMVASAAITYLALNTTENKARKTYWLEYFDLVKTIPYFLQEFQPKKGTQNFLRFPNGIFQGFSGASETASESENMLFMLMDEINFYDDVEKSSRAGGGHYDEARITYDAAKKRQQSRFMLPDGSMPEPCFLFAVCRETYPDSFIQKYSREIEEKGLNVPRTLSSGKVYQPAVAFTASQWDADPSILKNAVSYFWIRTPAKEWDAKIFEDEQEMKEDMTRVDSVAYRYDEQDLPKYVKVPNQETNVFLNDAKSNVEDFLRYTAGIPTDAIGRFFKRSAPIIEARRENGSKFPWNGDEIPFEVCSHPMTYEESNMRDGCILVRDRIARRESYEIDGFKDVVWRPFIAQNVQRAVRVDMGLTTDAAGIAIGCIPAWVERTVVNEDNEVGQDKVPFVWVDFVMRILPPGDGGQIQYSDIVQIISDFQKVGYKFAYASADGFQSENLLQTFSSMGMETRRISVDVDIAPYSLLKTLYYDNRISIYNNKIVEAELRNLECGRRRTTRAGKVISTEWVDHPKNGTKDVADALSGMVYHLVSETPKPVASRNMIPILSGRKVRPDECVDERVAQVNDAMKSGMLEKLFDMDEDYYG